MKKIIEYLLLGKPAKGENILTKQPRLHTVYPGGSPLCPRTPFNQWITDIRREFRVPYGA